MMATIQSVSVNHTDLHYRIDGNPEGKAVVFANSLGTDLRLWEAVIPLLPQELCYIRYDKRGHGLSSCPAPPYSMLDLSTDLEQLLEKLRVSNCLIVGLSIGGMIAQSLASRRPDLVQALVLSNTAAKMGEPEAWQDRISAIETGGKESLADAILTRWFAPEFLAKPEAKAWRHMLTRTPQSGYIGCCQAIATTDLSQATAQIKLPVMGIVGSEDGASPPDLVRNTIESIAGATFHIMQDTGHLPCVENPTAYAALLTHFFKETGHV